MNVAIIDADLLGRKNHRFPNLVCMKLSSYFKSQGNKKEINDDGVIVWTDDTKITS